MKDSVKDVRIYKTLFGEVSLCESCASALKLSTIKSHLLRIRSSGDCDACNNPTVLRVKLGMVQ